MKTFLVIIFVLPRIDRTRSASTVFFSFFFHFLFGRGIRTTNQEKGKAMTIKVILIGSRRIKLFFFVLVLAGTKGLFAYIRDALIGPNITVVSKHGPTTNWARERGGISTVLLHVLSFSSNAFFHQTKSLSLLISKLSPPRPPSPPQYKRG